MAEQQQFYLLLGNLMSPDNNIRKHSEVRDDTIAVSLCVFRELTLIALAKANSLAVQSSRARSEVSRQAW